MHPPQMFERLSADETLVNLQRQLACISNKVRFSLFFE